MRVIIATKNLGKLKEIKEIFKDIKVPLICLENLDKKFHIKENGKTFLENATKKALAVSKVYPDDLVIAEDSGLVVDYLGGKPGVFSKRYSGKNANSYKNNLKILEELKNVKFKDRKAHFVCVAVVAKAKKILKKFEGRLSGYINYEIKGEGGFGYDPIFYLPKYKKTVAELSLEEKNKISHRAKAFLKLKKYLIKKFGNLIFDNNFV